MAAKYEQLASMLKSELQTLRQQGATKLATEAELSARYHMSRQTVRHALQLLEEEGLIQRRQGSGSYLSQTNAPDTLRQIAVITTFLDDYIFPSILHDAQVCFAEAGYSTLVFATENKITREREILTRLLDQKVSALLVEGSKTALPTPNCRLFQQFRDRGIPVLFLHGIYSNLEDFPCLLDDNFHGGQQLAQYLLGKGRRYDAGTSGRKASPLRPPGMGAERAKQCLKLPAIHKTKKLTRLFLRRVSFLYSLRVSRVPGGSVTDAAHCPAVR